VPAANATPGAPAPASAAMMLCEGWNRQRQRDHNCRRRRDLLQLHDGLDFIMLSLFKIFYPAKYKGKLLASSSHRCWAVSDATGLSVHSSGRPWRLFSLRWMDRLG
jgi:hypothetical protein